MQLNFSYYENYDERLTSFGLFVGFNKHYIDSYK